MKKLLLIFLMPVFMFADEYEYSLQDYNATSPTYGFDVWNPEYTDYITMHYFSSQGWAGWTGGFFSSGISAILIIYLNPINLYLFLTK